MADQSITPGPDRQALLAAPLLACVVLLLLFLPQVNLEVTDKTGHESLPLLGPTKLARIGHLLLLMGVSAVLGWRLWQVRPTVWREPPRRAGLLLSLAALTTAPAVLPGPINGTNLFFAVEFMACIATVLVLYYLLRQSMGHEQIAEVIHRVMLVAFALLLLVLFAAFLVEPEMIYRTKLRGWRLGGSMLGANTLAMIGLMVSVSAYALVLPGRPWAWRVFAALMLVMGPLCLIMTRTRSLILLFVIAAVLVDLTRRADRARFRWMPIAVAGAIGLLVVTAPLFRTDRMLGSLVQGVAMVDGMENVIDDITSYLAFLPGIGEQSAASSAEDAAEGEIQGHGTIRDRLIVYRYCFDHLGDYWLFGTGYVEGGERFLAGVFADNPKMPWEPPHPHNIFFDLLLTRGVVFGAPLIIALVLACGYAARRILLPRAGEPALNLIGVQAAVLFGGSLGNFSIAGQVRPLLSALWLFAIVLLIDAAWRGEHEHEH